jgi:hypothetical protein
MQEKGNHEEIHINKNFYLDWPTLLCADDQVIIAKTKADYNAQYIIYR